MSKRPNIILYNWHDAGDWFGCYGYEHVDTPNVDRLAAGGARFANNRSACAICSPSRAAIATGMYCQNNGVMALTNSPFNNRIYPHVPHMMARFKDSGYRTALFGIQHEAAHEHVSEIMKPDEQFATDPWPNADIIRHYCKKWLGERGQDSDDAEPFFMQIGSIDAHLNRFYSGAPARSDEPYPPVQDEQKGLFMPGYLQGSDADKATIATLQGLIQRGDRMVGDVMDALEEAGLAENTLFIMNVDHGVGLSRAKATCYDPGITTACVMRWPRKIPAGKVIDQLTTHVDVLPTVLSLLDIQTDEQFDGCDFSQHVIGDQASELHDYVYSHMVENTRSLRNNKWKLIRNFRPSASATMRGDCASQHKSFDFERVHAAADVEPCDQFLALELYDLEADPNELQNLARNTAYAETVDELNAQLWTFLLDNDDFLVHDAVRTPWQLATRKELEAHCQNAQRKAPLAEGPLINAIDAASAIGTVLK